MGESAAVGEMSDPLRDELGDKLEGRLTASLPRLRRHLARRRPVPGIELDDLAQEVLARALRYRARYDPRRALWPWLRTLAERVRSDQRTAGKRRAAPLSALDPQPPEPAARGDGCARVDADDELERLLAPLSAREREVLVRFHQHGQSVRAIAAALALPEGTVKSHLSRARRRLAGLSEDANPSEKEPPHA